MAMQHSSSKSTRKVKRQLGILFHSVQQGLHSDLHLFSCDIMVLCERANMTGNEACILPCERHVKSCTP